MEITLDCEYCFIRSHVRFEDATAAEGPVFCPGCGSELIEENNELDFDV